MGVATVADKIKRIQANRDAYRKSHFKQVVFTPSEDDIKVAQACAQFIRTLDEAYQESAKSTLVFRASVSKERN